MNDDRVWWVARRFEEITPMLLARGYAPAPGPRDPNEWDEKHQEDPPIGLVRIKAIRLVDPEDDDSAFDSEIFFSVREFWSSSHVPGAQNEHGFYLVGYSYHAHWHGVDRRWDFDPVGHPEMPYHLHPPGQAKRVAMTGPMSPEDALDRFESWIRDQR